MAIKEKEEIRVLSKEIAKDAYEFILKGIDLAIENNEEFFVKHKHQKKDLASQALISVLFGMVENICQPSSYGRLCNTIKQNDKMQDLKIKLREDFLKK